MKPKRSYPGISRAALRVERAQCEDEGRDLSVLAAQFDTLDVDEVSEDPALAERAGALLDASVQAPLRGDYAFEEPSGPAGIRAARADDGAALPAPPAANVLRDKAHGAWTGRCAGCLLGKPVEGRRRSDIELYLRSQGRWPLVAWFSNQADPAVRKDCGFPAPDAPVYAETIDRMVEDDDTNYTVTGLAVMTERGPDFTPADIATFWLRSIPYRRTYTAEQVAYRNLINGLPVPDAAGAFEGPFSTATYRNPHREWIGAQIRADFFGYVRPGDPAAAAELAWRDAAVSHVKNGIYGEMWVAAMLAAAYVLDDVKDVIRAGLAQVPARSRLRRDIEAVFTWRREGRSYEEAVAAVHEQWDEAFGHHWCHTNSNAQIVAIALLWGEMDFGRTICAAVMPGFDTDCNGATAGSVLGLMLGRRVLPAAWADPLHDTLETGVHGHTHLKLEDLAAETVRLAGV